MIEDLGLHTTYEKLNKAIELENPTDSHILKIHVTDKDPKLAKEISNAMAEAVADNISTLMSTDKPSIVERAIVSKKPSSPSLIKNTAMGGAVGALAAMGIIIARYLLDDTIKTEEDVRKYLQMNTLASIPLEKKHRKKKSA